MGKDGRESRTRKREGKGEQKQGPPRRAKPSCPHSPSSQPVLAQHRGCRGLRWGDGEQLNIIPDF